MWALPGAGQERHLPHVQGKVARHALKGHTDAVWSLALNPQASQLISAAADDTVKCAPHYTTPHHIT